MPKFLKEKLKKEYGDNKHAIYGTMNKLGFMKGNKETAKGRTEEKKHEMAHKIKNKDTRDSFMKELDQHKVDRMKYR